MLEDQVEELKPTVSLIYCPQSRLKDNEIKGYLIYLLKLKDYYEHEVKTKQEMIQERDEQVNYFFLYFYYYTAENRYLLFWTFEYY